MTPPRPFRAVYDQDGTFVYLMDTENAPRRVWAGEVILDQDREQTVAYVEGTMHLLKDAIVRERIRQARAMRQQIEDFHTP
jgi:hypothetical protein